MNIVYYKKSGISEEYIAKIDQVDKVSIGIFKPSLIKSTEKGFVFYKHDSESQQLCFMTSLNAGQINRVQPCNMSNELMKEVSLLFHHKYRECMLVNENDMKVTRFPFREVWPEMLWTLVKKCYGIPMEIPKTDNVRNFIYYYFVTEKIVAVTLYGMIKIKKSEEFDYFNLNILDEDKNFIMNGIYNIDTQQFEGPIVYVKGMKF